MSDLVGHDTEESATHQLASRGSVYRLLSLLWRREPDLPLLQHLKSPTVRVAWESVGGELPLAEEAAVDALAIDYCQLFIGPKGHLPPFQSIWETGQFCGRALASMGKYVDLSGYDTADVDAGMLDHLAIQLDVMAHILEQLSNAPEQREALDGLTASFLEAHLSWPGSLFNAVEVQAGTPFYLSLATITRSFLDIERLH